MNRITAKDFLDTYNCDTRVLEMRKYIPIKEKIQFIDSLLENVIITDKKLFAVYDPINVEIIFKLAAITTYTNMDASDLDDYDILCKSGTLDEILCLMGSDYCELSRLFKIRLEDTLKEKNSFESIYSKCLSQLTSLVEKIDPNEIQELMKLVKMFG